MAVVASAVPVYANGQILEQRTIGTSIQGRPIQAYRLGDPKGVTVAIIGVIHGNEEAGLLITDELLNNIGSIESAFKTAHIKIKQNLLQIYTR